MIKMIINVALFIFLLTIGTYVSIFAVFMINFDNNIVAFASFILFAWGFAIVSRVVIWFFRKKVKN